MKTDRLTFKTWRVDLLNKAEELWMNSEVTKFIGGSLSPEGVQSRLNSEMENLKLYKVQYWPIFISDSDTFIGCCGLRPYNIEKKEYEIGFHILPKYWGQGYGKEAAKKAIEYGFNIIRANSIFAGHNPKNLGSKYLLSKLDFIYTHDEFYKPTGLNHPSYILRN